jgi:8-oxo-dGTP pyrophosphatase MutT (NUDIX family)
VATAGDGASIRFPVSVKGVVLRDGCVLLVSNPRGEWELPGGKLESDETPETCVAREIAEELGLDATVGPVVDAWVYRVTADVDVLVVTYGCEVASWPASVASPEGKDVGFFAPDALDGIPLPRGYHAAIHRWAARRSV